MLYIIQINRYTIKFHDNNGRGHVYGIDLEARADLLGRIWISDIYFEKNVLNSCKVSDIALWNGTEYVTYETAAEFVDAFNEVTTPTVVVCQYGVNNSAVYI